MVIIIVFYDNAELKKRFPATSQLEDFLRENKKEKEFLVEKHAWLKDPFIKNMSKCNYWTLREIDDMKKYLKGKEIPEEIDIKL